jgi:hypothetical protein
VPADDRMQAFLWRHLLPADDLKVLVFDPKRESPAKRAVPVRPPPVTTTPPAPPGPGTEAGVPTTPKFSRQQVEARLRELKRLYEDGYLTDEFYLDRAAECEAGQ